MLLFVLVAVAHVTQLELDILLRAYSESIFRRKKGHSCSREKKHY